MTERTVEDRLREEYFVLLPDAERILEELEAEVWHCLLPVLRSLDKYERIVVTSRIKGCESALGALRQPEGGVFDLDKVESYTLTDLNDFVGVRVLAFPRSRLVEANDSLRLCQPFSKWNSDPDFCKFFANDESKEPLAFKYHGYCSRNTKLRAELQIVPMLMGLFWEVEHSTIYKPSPQLKGVSASPEMKQRTGDVWRALKTFEDEFERLVRQSA